MSNHRHYPLNRQLRRSVPSTPPPLALVSLPLVKFTPPHMWGWALCTSAHPWLTPTTVTKRRHISQVIWAGLSLKWHNLVSAILVLAPLCTGGLTLQLCNLSVETWALPIEWTTLSLCCQHTTSFGFGLFAFGEFPPSHMWSWAFCT